MSIELATQEQPKKMPIAADERGLKLSSLDDIWRFALCAVNSGIYKDLPSPEVAVIKIQAGMEIGLTPVFALTNIFVVNGKPTVYGDALLGIVLGNPQCEDVIETMQGNGEGLAAVCEVKRKGRAPVVRTFSVNDAKAAGLWKKAGPWTQYPQRMLAMRARAFACRDAFADALRGIALREEIADIEPRQVTGRTIETTNLQFADELPDKQAREPIPPVSREAEVKVKVEDGPDWPDTPDQPRDKDGNFLF